MKDKHLQATRWPRIGRRDCRREPDAPRIVSGNTAISHARLTHGDRTDAGHHLALGQMPVANDADPSIVGLQIGMLGEELGDLGLDSLSQKGARPIAQNLGKRILE